jgi:hypothetical protein
MEGEVGEVSLLSQRVTTRTDGWIVGLRCSG